MSIEGAFFVVCLCYILIGLACEVRRLFGSPLEPDRLPEPDRSTLRRPVVDPNWEVEYKARVRS